MLSHELRSPLLGISSLVQRLRENQTDKEVLSALKSHSSYGRTIDLFSE